MTAASLPAWPRLDMSRSNNVWLKYMGGQVRGMASVEVLSAIQAGQVGQEFGELPEFFFVQQALKRAAIQGLEIEAAVREIKAQGGRALASTVGRLQHAVA